MRLPASAFTAGGKIGLERISLFSSSRVVSLVDSSRDQGVPPFGVGAGCQTLSDGFSGREACGVTASAGAATKRKRRAVRRLIGASACLGERFRDVGAEELEGG